MKQYKKPVFKSYCNIKVLGKLGFVQTQYAVQFSIQAIEFQVSKNINEKNQTVYTAKSSVEESKKLS